MEEKFYGYFEVRNPGLDVSKGRIYYEFDTVSGSFKFLNLSRVGIIDHSLEPENEQQLQKYFELREKYKKSSTENKDLVTKIENKVSKIISSVD